MPKHYRPAVIIPPPPFLHGKEKELQLMKQIKTSPIRVPPTHLSPSVDNEKEGYIPERAEIIKKMQAAQNQVLPLPSTGEEDWYNSIVEAMSGYNEVAEKKRRLEMLEKQYHEELKLETEGNTFSNLSNKKVDNPPDVVDEDDAKEANGHVDDPIKQAQKDDIDILLPFMSRKKRGLFKAIEINKERKRSKVELLKERKRKAESSASAKGR